MNRVILPLAGFLLMILTDRSGLATGVDSSDYYDEVKVTVFNRASNLTVVGFSYPSMTRQKYPKLCDIKIYSRMEDCDTLLTGFEECTVVYYEGEHCNTGLIDLAKRVKEQDGRAMIFWTTHKDDDLKLLYNANVDIPVILVKNNGIIRYKDESVRQVNITLTGQANFPTTRPTDGGFTNQRSTTTFYFVVFAFTILLLLSLTWFIFNYLRRCHHMYTAKRRRAELLSKTRKAIEKCPTKTYKKPKKLVQKTSRDEDTDSVTSDDDEKCAICLETYKTKDILRILPCQHEFHKICIDPWLFEKGTCPMCKHNIVGNQECLNESTNRELRMLTMTQPGMLDLGSLEEGLENDSDDQRRDNDGDLQVEIIE